MSNYDFEKLKHVLFIVDVRNLQHFVTISLATAVGGEGDYARDLLSRLRTVGGGFEELIYKLSPETGYKELEKKCEVLWVTLTNTPDLPDLLVCNFLASIILIYFVLVVGMLCKLCSKLYKECGKFYICRFI